MAIGGKGEKPVIGYTTLEILGFKVNLLTGKLERTAAIEYAAAVSRLEIFGFQFGASPQDIAMAKEIVSRMGVL